MESGSKLQTHLVLLLAESIRPGEMDEEAGICKACGQQSVIWDTEHGHAICHQCGTVDDGQQLLAELNVDRVPAQPAWTSLHDPLSRHTQSRMHSVRGKQWHLINNLQTNRRIIHNLCDSLGFGGTERAFHHFEAAMAKGDFHWGNEAKLVSAVCVAISMTESKRTEAIPRIASLLGESTSNVLRMWSRVTDTLELFLRPTTPLLNLEILRAYLQDVLAMPYGVPAILRNTFSLSGVSLDAVFGMAEQIDAFLDASQGFASSSAASVACAVLVLALESVHGAPIQPAPLPTMVKYLCDRVGAAPTRVLEHRKSMMAIFEDWGQYLPWVPPRVSIDAPTLWANSRKSAAVRVLPDVLQFQHEIRAARPMAENASSDQGLTIVPEDGEVSPSFRLLDTYRTRRRPKGAQLAQRVISQLLSPNADMRLSSMIQREDVQDRLSRIELQVLHSQNEPLSRLQALALRRGGESNVTDEELFEEGELDGYLNSEAVAQYLHETHPEWDDHPQTESIPNIETGNRELASGHTQTNQLLAEAHTRRVWALGHGTAVLSTSNDHEEEEEGGEDGNPPLDRDSYMAMGLQGDYEGVDPDTARYFGSEFE